MLFRCSLFLLCLVSATNACTCSVRLYSDFDDFCTGSYSTYYARDSSCNRLAPSVYIEPDVFCNDFTISTSSFCSSSLSWSSSMCRTRNGKNFRVYCNGGGSSNGSYSPTNNPVTHTFAWWWVLAALGFCVFVIVGSIYSYYLRRQRMQRWGAGGARGTALAAPLVASAATAGNPYAVGGQPNPYAVNTTPGAANRGVGGAPPPANPYVQPAQPSYVQPQTAYPVAGQPQPTPGAPYNPPPPQAGAPYNPPPPYAAAPAPAPAGGPYNPPPPAASPPPPITPQGAYNPPPPQAKEPAPLPPQNLPPPAEAPVPRTNEQENQDNL